jgi:hypothetical protein
LRGDLLLLRGDLFLGDLPDAFLGDLFLGDLPDAFLGDLFLGDLFLGDRPNALGDRRVPFLGDDLTTADIIVCDWSIKTFFTN